LRPRRTPCIRRTHPAALFASTGMLRGCEQCRLLADRVDIGMSVLRQPMGAKRKCLPHLRNGTFDPELTLSFSGRRLGVESSSVEPRMEADGLLLGVAALLLGSAQLDLRSIALSFAGLRQAQQGRLLLPHQEQPFTRPPSSILGMAFISPRHRCWF